VYSSFPSKSHSSSPLATHGEEEKTPLFLFSAAIASSRHLSWIILRSSPLESGEIGGAHPPLQVEFFSPHLLCRLLSLGSSSSRGFEVAVGVVFHAIRFCFGIYRIMRLFDVMTICPRASEEHEPLSSVHAPASAISSGPIFRTNLETSSPDTYRAPPPPLPYDMDLAGPQSVPRGFETSGNKADPELQSESQPLEEIDAGKGCPKNIEDKPSKKSDYITTPIEEEDTCPICLEGIYYAYVKDYYSPFNISV
ncbi:hypothetical protein Taro_052653, partial [Colocasia esculenta]|nr:hypothetical protein [Colocasia esculenta]